MQKSCRNVITVLLCLLLMVQILPIGGTATQTTADHVLISQIYGAGGNKNATYNADFIELYNPTNQDISLSGWSLQYGSATGTWPCQATSRYILSGTIKAHSYYLITCMVGSNGDPLPVSADESNCGLSLAESKGKLALVCGTELITASNGPTVVDFVGYGSANESESACAPAPSKTSSIIRKTDGVDTDSNAADFVTSTPPAPRNSQITIPGASESTIVSITDGTYLISFGEMTLSSLPESSNSGYPSSGHVNTYNPADIVILTNTGNNRFTITDIYGRYYFLNGTDTAFHLAATPIVGHLWTLLTADDGTYYLKNAHTNQYVTYSPESGTWCCYPYASNNSKLTITPTQLTVCQHNTGTVAQCIDESCHRLLCDHCNTVLSENAPHAFADGKCRCGLMQWVKQPETGKVYKLGLYHVLNQSHYFLNGAMDGYFLGATTEVSSAINVSLEAVDGGYYLRCLIGGNLKYIDIYMDGNYVRIAYRNTPSCLYTWDETTCTLVTTISAGTYYLCGYPSYTTISPVHSIEYPTHLYEVPNNSCIHVWQSATCTEPETCKLCGQINGDPLSHAYLPASCTAPATCTRCGHTTGDHLDHSFTNYSSNNDATCTKDGTKTATCNRCTATDTVTDHGSALGHAFSNYQANGDATCTEDGTKTSKCDRCSVTSTITDKGSAGHIDLDGNYLCDRCNAVLCKRCSDAPDDADHLCDQCGTRIGNHSYGQWIDLEKPTCTQAGTQVRSCNCGDTEKRSKAAFGHSFSAYKSNSDATCASDGTKTAKCSRCGQTDTMLDQGSALGHLWSDATCEAPKTCYRCGKTDGNALGHRYGQWTITAAPTCTKSGMQSCTCSCGAGKQEILPALGHSLTKIAAVPPTETATGLLEHYQCQTCSNRFADSKGTQSVTLSDVTVDKLPSATEAPNEDAPIPAGIVLDFSMLENRTSLTNEQQIWMQNGITVVNCKGNATVNIADYYQPVRFYKNTDLTISYTSIIAVQFYCATPAYARSLAASLSSAGYQASITEKIVTITLPAPQRNISFQLTDGQVRMDAILISEGMTLPPEEPTQPSLPPEPSDPPTEPVIPTDPTVPDAPTEPPLPTDPTVPSEPTAPSAPEDDPANTPTTQAPTEPTIEETLPATNPSISPSDPILPSTDSIPSEPSVPTQAPDSETIAPDHTDPVDPTQSTDAPIITTKPKTDRSILFFLIILVTMALGITLYGVYKKRTQ